jgi:pyrroloquinoline quinone (PQQ) biosynthesis protein C
MIGIEPWRMDCFTEDMLIPGKNFNQRLEEIYLSPNAYVGIGSVILMEIQAKQFDLCLGQEFRKTNIELSKIKWLILHEELEVDHADEALIVARLASESDLGVIGARTGIHQARKASWSFFDELYRCCYGA